MTPVWLDPDRITSKSSPPNLYALPSPINMATEIGQHTKLPPNSRSCRQT